jgi:hypothetical protein
MAMRTLLLVLALALALSAQAAMLCPIRRHRTPGRALYSEGCDSRPRPTWPSSGRGLRARRVVPIALHVDYWDYIGWKDPYAKQAFSARQRKMASLARAAMVYTPQVLLQGRDFRHWAAGAFDREVAKINAQPAKARISLLLERPRPGFEVRRRWSAGPPAAGRRRALPGEKQAVSESAAKTAARRCRTLRGAAVDGPIEFRTRSLPSDAPPAAAQAVPSTPASWLSCKTGRVARSCRP